MKKLLLTAVLTAVLPCKAADVCAVGIGILQATNAPRTVITYVAPNSPAALAGIAQGNILAEVDGFKTYNPLVGVKLKETYEMLRGNCDTSLTLTYIDNSNKKQTKTLTRKNFPVKQPQKTKAQIEFEKYWYQIAPIELDGWQPLGASVETRLPKLWIEGVFYQYSASKNLYKYWEDRKDQFARGYDMCLRDEEKNICLQNLIAKETDKLTYNKLS